MTFSLRPHPLIDDPLPLFFFFFSTQVPPEKAAPRLFLFVSLLSFTSSLMAFAPGFSGRSEFIFLFHPVNSFPRIFQFMLRISPSLSVHLLQASSRSLTICTPPTDQLNLCYSFPRCKSSISPPFVLLVHVFEFGKLAPHSDPLLPPCGGTFKPQRRAVVQSTLFLFPLDPSPLPPTQLPVLLCRRFNSLSSSPFLYQTSSRNRKPSRSLSFFFMGAW